MASATNISDAQTPRGDAAIVYGKRDNITVPGADQTDAAVTTTVPARAAARETDRTITKRDTSGTFTPDAADYTPHGSETGAP